MPVNGLPPSTRVSLHTYFFIASEAGDPGTARLAPARRTGDRLFKPELIGQRRGIFESVLPFGRHVGQTLLHYLRR